MQEKENKEDKEAELLAPYCLSDTKQLIFGPGTETAVLWLGYRLRVKPNTRPKEGDVSDIRLCIRSHCKNM